MSLTTLQSWEYLASYGDLINAFGPNVAKASAHYDTFVATHIETRPITFDAWGYLASYDDLISAFHSDVIAAARHYVTYGYNEHRDTNTFDAQAYLNNYSDLQAAFGSNLVKAEEHYVTFGRAEGRNDYTLTAASASSLDASGHVAEGNTVQFTLDTHDLAQGTTFAYALTGAGITLSDLASGILSGVATVGADGKAIISVSLASDHSTEGAETLTLTTAGHAASIVVDDASILDPVGTFTLTADTDIKSANIFIAPLVYTPGGNDRINSLQDEDQLTGTGSNARLDLTLGDYNDNGQPKITPVLNNIKTVNIAVTDTGGSGMTLDLQDSDSVLTNVNITRISSSDSDVINMHKEAVNLSVSNAQDLTNITFTYIDDELIGTKAAGTSDVVNLTLSKVNADNLLLGSQSVNFNQIETVNLTVAANGASTVNLTNLRPDSLPETNQRLNITANASLVLGEDVSLDHSSRPAAPAVPAAACYGTPAFAGLSGHDLGYIEHNNAFTDATVASLNYITITGAGNVTLASVGSAPAFVLDGSTSTGNIAVNISNSADDATASFTTGDGNDTVLVDSYITGYAPVSGGGTIPVYAYPDFAAGVNEASGNANAADNHALVYGLVTGKGDDVVLANDLAITGGISTGDGNDFVSVDELLGSVGAPIIKDYAGATVNLGDGNNWINALNLGEEARIISGSGNDVVNLTTVINDGSGKTVIHADSGALDADTNSAEVNTGAGNDLVNFTFTGASLNDLVNFGADNYSFTPGYSVIEGLVNGGDGTTDEIRVTGNKDLDLVLGNSGDAPRVTNVEVLTLNSSTAYDLAFKTAFEANKGYRTISVNDNNAETADYRVNINEFDANLQTINLNHCDGVIRNIYPEYAGYKAFAGDDATDTLFNLRGTETIHVRALETDLFDPHFYSQKVGLATNVSAANDELGTVYSAGASATSWAAPFNTDLTVNLRLQTNAIATDVAHVVLEDVPTLSDPANSPLDPLDVNYDVTIDDLATNDQTQPAGYLGTDVYESLDLTVNGADNHGVNLKNDFDVALTVTGTDTKGGNLTIINVDAASINTTGYQGNVYLGVESTYNHTIITGIGNDIIRLGDEKAIALGKDSVDAGEGNDIVVFNGTGTTSVNHAGLDNLDTVKGGAGNDILAFGGKTSLSVIGELIGVTLGATEWQHVSGFETIQLSAGQATPESSLNDYYAGMEPHGTSTWTKGHEVWINNGDYYLNVTNDLIDTNGGDVLHFVNNNVDDSGVTVGVNNGSVSLNTAPLIQLGPVSEGDTTLNLLGLNSSNQITYDGAIGDGGAYYYGVKQVGPSEEELVVHHGSNDRFIFTDVNLEGLDTIDGGAPDSNGAGTWVGNGDVLEIRHLAIDGDAPEVVGADLANLTNIGTIVFNNDTAGNQTLIIGGVTFDDAVVDALVDNLHTSTSAQSETLYIVAEDGSLPGDYSDYGSAILNLDASDLTDRSNLDITLDTHRYVANETYDWNYSGGGSGYSNSYWGVANDNKVGNDIIVTGGGDDTIHGVTLGDQVDGQGGDNTIDFTTDLADMWGDWAGSTQGDAQFTNIDHFVTANNSNLALDYQTENLDIIIGNDGGLNNNQVIGGSGINTLTFTDDYTDLADTAMFAPYSAALNNQLIQHIQNLVVDGRLWGAAVDGAIDNAGVDGITHFPHENITIVDHAISVDISDQLEAFHIALTDNVGGSGDTLYSGHGDDTIVGGTGSDWIQGGLGADQITVGAGSNVLYYAHGDSGITFATADVIADFTAGTVNFDLGVAGDGVAGTGNYVELLDATYGGNEVAIKAALNAAALALSGTTSHTGSDLYVFACDNTGADTGYIGHDYTADGVIDQIIILTGIDNAHISAADFV